MEEKENKYMNGMVKENGPRIRDNDDPNLPPPSQDQFYQYYTGHPPQKSKLKVKGNILLLIFIICFILLGLYLLGDNRLESFYFTFDSDADVDDALLDVLYYNLDEGSRMNVNNETYFMILSIPELNYSVRFDYLFEFISNNHINLRIEDHDEVQRITNFEARTFNGYNLSIEFHINSTDPDILNVMIFPPDNVISGVMTTYSVDSWHLSVNLDEGEERYERGRYFLILPFNQRVREVTDYEYRFPFT